MKENTALKQTLFALLVFLLIGILALLVANGFFAYKLYRPPQPISMDSLIEGTLLALTQTQSAIPTESSTETQPAATETVQPSPEVSATEPPPATATPTSELVVNGMYTVRENETLPGIAVLLGLTEDDLRNANQMVGSTIFTGQTLRAPENPPAASYTYQFSSLTETDRFSVVYPLANSCPVPVSLLADPAQNPANALEPLSTLAEASLIEIDKILQVQPDTALRMIIAGTLFEGNTLARAITAEPDSIFIIYDGTGSQRDQQRWMTYALARMLTEKSWGPAASEMIREGTAWMTANENINSNDHILPLQQQCKSFLDASVLPVLTEESMTFGNENTHWINHSTAACFMEYLYPKTDPEDFQAFYRDGDYQAHFGATLEALEAEFRQWLSGLPASENMPQEWVAGIKRHNALFVGFMSAFNGAPEGIEIYRQLDLARMALLGNDLLSAETHLNRAEALGSQ